MCGPGQTSPTLTNARLPVLVLKLLKMATGMRALLDTVVQALPQVGRQLRGLAWVWLPCPQGGHHRRPREDKAAGGPPHWSGIICSRGLSSLETKAIIKPLPATCRE